MGWVDGYPTAPPLDLKRHTTLHGAGGRLQTFADRSAVEQNYHDVKEVWGAGKQQVRTIWANIGAFNLNLWMHTLVELWAWHKPARKLRDRSNAPWDDEDRRPSHAVRRKALQREILGTEFSALSGASPKSAKIRTFFTRLLRLGA